VTALPDPLPAAEPEPSSRPGGRPLDLSRDDAIRQAALEVLADVGYDRLTIDAVAARAKAGKATVYRRWAGKAELLVDAVACRAHPTIAAPDTGSLRGDLHAVLDAKVAAADRGELREMFGLISALPHNPDLQRAFRARFMSSEGLLRTAIDRAAARGEVPAGRDLDLLANLLPALSFHRLLLTGELPDPDFARKVIDEVVLPLATAPLPTPAP
jgi:AcrR family transcriptional regulator